MLSMDDMSPSLALARTLGALYTIGATLERLALLPASGAPRAAPRSPPSVPVAAGMDVACLLAGFRPTVFLA